MIWQTEIKGFITYLQLERSLTKNTIESYQRDVENFAHFITDTNYRSPSSITLEDLQLYLNQLNDLGVAESTQARFISGLRSFYRYLVLEQLADYNPTDLLEMPKLIRKLPSTLNHDEIQRMLQSIDLSQVSGHRNKAILQVLYGCGLRVSELTSLRYSNYYPNEEFIRVVGKGNKERLVPIHQGIIKEIKQYETQQRNFLTIKPKAEDFIFLSVRGNTLSRVMIFNIVKKAAQDAEIQQTISPHTLRHSFATELVKNGANLRAVQQMLGHASITTTEIYTHLDQQHLVKTLEEFHPLYHAKY